MKFYKLILLIIIAKCVRARTITRKGIYTVGFLIDTLSTSFFTYRQFTPENTITYHNALCLSPQKFVQALFSVSLGEKLKTILMQNFGVANRERYRMLRYFLEWCCILIFVEHSFSLYLRIEALLLSYFTKFYDHLETLLLNLHNVLLTKKLNLFLKQLGSQVTQIFRCKSKQDNN